jgi:aldehyde dehydrogenase (NAD+)
MDFSEVKGRNYYGGEWHEERSGTFVAINPATSAVYGEYPISNREIVSNAVKAARIAFLKWRNVSRVQRAEYFDKLAQLIKRDHEKLRDAISLETGKNLNESHAEVIEALHMCQVVAGSGRLPYGYTIASELSTKDAYVIRKPKGVVGVISPWNFPMAIGAFWSSAPAIAEGNTVVHKPSELTPMINQLVAQLYEEAGFPEGVYNLIHGQDGTGRLLVREHVDVILFTGSASVGQEIRRVCAESWHKTCSVECGSKSATILFEDGDQELAKQVMLASAFKLSGQRCVSSGRLLIQRSIFNDFVKEFVAEVAEKATTGDPFSDPAPFYGPLISNVQRERVEQYNFATHNDDGVNVHLNGRRLDGEDGYYLTPHVYETEWGAKNFLREEVFGPHVALIPFNDLDHAINIYNDTPYGLALGVITDDFRKHRRLVNECYTGMIYINGGSIAAESHLPFGGVGKSGNGHKSAAGTYRAVTEEIAVTVNYEKGQVSWAQGMK